MCCTKLVGSRARGARLPQAKEALLSILKEEAWRDVDLGLFSFFCGWGSKPRIDM